MCLRRGGRKLHDDLQTLIALPFSLSNPTKNQITRNSYKIYSESLEGRDHFGDVVVDVMIRFVIVQWSDGNVIYVGLHSLFFTKRIHSPPSLLLNQ